MQVYLLVESLELYSSTWQWGGHLCIVRALRTTPRAFFLFFFARGPGAGRRRWADFFFLVWVRCLPGAGWGAEKSDLPRKKPI